jgi:hypothetical protein
MTLKDRLRRSALELLLSPAQRTWRISAPSGSAPLMKSGDAILVR